MSLFYKWNIQVLFEGGVKKQGVFVCEHKESGKVLKHLFEGDKDGYSSIKSEDGISQIGFRADNILCIEVTENLDNKGSAKEVVDSKYK